MECNDNTCSTEKGDDCCGGNGCGDMLEMWHIATRQAMIETKKDAIKKVLQAQFGEAIDESAKAVVKAIGAKIKSDITEAQAMSTLKKELGEILSKAVEKCETTDGVKC